MEELDTYFRRKKRDELQILIPTVGDRVGMPLGVAVGCFVGEFEGNCEGFDVSLFVGDLLGEDDGV